MQFPERPTGNGWQLFGQALGQGAGVLDKYAADVSEEEKRKNVLQELVARRTAAALEQQRQAREDQMREIQFTQSQEKYKQDKDKADRQDKQAKEYRDYVGAKTETKPAFKAPILGPGFGPNGETEIAMPAEYSPVPRTREELAMKALELEQISPDKYLDDTKPATGLTQEDRLALIAAHGASRAPQRDRFAIQNIGGRKVQINLDTHEQTDLGEAPPAPGQGQKDLTPGEIDKLSELGDKRATVAGLFSGFKPEYAGFGKGLSNKIGEYTGGKGVGASPEQVQWWKDYATLKNQVRNNLFGASLTPGEKSEFDKTAITTTTDADVIKINLAKQQAILDAAIQRKKAIYTAGSRVNMDQVNSAFGESGPAPAAPSGQPQEGAEKTNSSGRPVVFRNGRWVAK